MRVRIASAGLWVLDTPAALGQQASATVTGVITDASGASVPGAKIELKSSQTGVVRPSQTNGSGSYTYVDIIPGAYTLQAAKEGFSSQNVPQFTLQVNQTATINLQLRVGESQQAVTVEANATAVESSTSELGTVINTKEVNNLPLNGRNFTQLLTLTPGASPANVDQSSGGGGGFVGHAIGSFSFPALNGSRNRSNMFVLDGVNDLNIFLTTYNISPIIDSVQEFKVQSHNDLAEFGGVTGGIINVVSKSGTNAYHGSLWEFLRNSDMDARNFFAQNVNPLRRNQFGAAAGGPVWIPKIYNGKNKSFFYAAYEGYRDREAQETGAYGPSDAKRAGNFGQLCSAGFDATGLCKNASQQIYNPYSTRPDPSHPGQLIRDPFQNNLIPTNLLSPTALLYQSILPHAGTLINGSNVFVPTGIKDDQDQGQVRGDQYFGAKDQLMVRFAKYYQLYDTPTNVIATQQAPIYGYNIAVHETHTFGPTSVLDLHFGRNFGENDRTSVLPGATPAFTAALVQAGLSPQFATVNGKSQWPAISPNGYFGTPWYQIQNTQFANVWQFGGDFTKIIDRHTLKTGADFQTTNTESPIYGNDIPFSASQTAGLGSLQGIGGDAWASFLLGAPSGGNYRSTIESTHGGWTNGFYLQDQWKVTNRLTVNIGARYDLILWPIYGAGKDLFTGDTDFATGNYIVTALPSTCSATQGAPCIPNGAYVNNGGQPTPYNGLPPHVLLTPQRNHAIINNDYKTWSGRLGIAYALTGKTAIRAGYGRFYDAWGAVTQLAQNYNGNWPGVGTLNQTNLNPAYITASINDPLSFGSSGSIVYPPPTPYHAGNWMIDPNYKIPYSDQYNFGIQQQVANDTVLDVSYVGANGRHLDYGPQANTAVTPGPGDQAAVQARQPYPYLSPTWFDTSVGVSDYQALDVSLNKRATRNVSFLVSYTWSKSIDDGCSGFIGAACDVQDIYNRRGDRSVSSFDIPQNFSLSFSLNSPFGPGGINANRFVNAIAGGWVLNGIAQLHSGQPYDVVTSNSIPNVCSCNSERANLVGDPNAGNLGINSAWFNTAAFANPANYTFGSEGRNVLRSDWWKNLDLSLFRQFHAGLGEQRYFEFRIEAFNLLNDVVFAQPDALMTDANYGHVTAQANVERQLQLSLKFYF